MTTPLPAIQTHPALNAILIAEERDPVLDRVSATILDRGSIGVHQLRRLYPAVDPQRVAWAVEEGERQGRVKLWAERGNTIVADAALPRRPEWLTIAEAMAAR